MVGEGRKHTARLALYFFCGAVFLCGTPVLCSIVRLCDVVILCGTVLLCATILLCGNVRSYGTILSCGTVIRYHKNAFGFSSFCEDASNSESRIAILVMADLI